MIEATGLVRARDAAAINNKMKTGQVEVAISNVTVLNKAKTVPFDIVDGVNASEETKLKYRYLDLRRPEMQQALITRSKIMTATHAYFDSEALSMWKRQL